MTQTQTGKTIQVDMFEVQLGAALLMQFRRKNGEVVRVLADAGVDKASGYNVDHVYSKLFGADGQPTEVWTAFSAEQPRLNLIIGTHYDADHLRGLAPIIRSSTLVIDEIWLPPVQSEDAPTSASTVSGGDAHLAQQLLDDDSGKVVNRYLERKAAAIREVDAIYQPLMERHRSLRTPVFTGQHRSSDLQDFHIERPVDLSRALEMFEREVSTADQRLGYEVEPHAQDHDDAEEFEAVRQAAHDIRQKARFSMADLNLEAPTRGLADDASQVELALSLSRDSSLASDILAFENIRKSNALDAITAIHLNEIIQAIKDRHSAGLLPKIRVRCETISAGKPRYFRWRGQKFVEANAASNAELGFHLLGPSKELVAKLQEKIPVGLMMLAYRARGLNSGTVTPSNRLSYVARFHLNEQAILVTGDAGFSDFTAEGSNTFYPILLKCLQSLHVVQIAHHGGINHRFYEALDAAELPKQTQWCFLLLSHAEHDKTRPRAEFDQFVALFRWDQREDVSVLFTSQPSSAKVTGFSDLVHPAVVPGGGTAMRRGDVRLGYPFNPDPSKADTRWKVEKHFIHLRP